MLPPGAPVVMAVPSNFTVIAEFAAKLLPVTVTDVPAGPLVGFSDIDWDVTVIVACGAFAVALDESVTVRPSTYEPDTSGVNVGAGAVAFDSVALEPVGTVRVYAYVDGDFPPVVVVLRVIRFPVVLLDCSLLDAVPILDCDVTVIVACGAFAVALDESVTVRPSTYEPDTSGVNVGAGAVAFDSVALEP